MANECDGNQDQAVAALSSVYCFILERMAERKRLAQQATPEPDEQDQQGEQLPTSVSAESGIS